MKRASVSIVFDNSDKRRNKCPLGYEKYDEIVVSRTVEEASNCKVIDSYSEMSCRILWIYYGACSFRVFNCVVLFELSLEHKEGCSRYVRVRPA